jgi:hypothetical protein
VYQRGMAPPPDRNRWLLLIHQLPKEPAYLRVKVGRRLARVGAVALKNSVYVLPKQEGTTEDFQWVRREIIEAGGEATVVEAQLLEGISDSEVEAKFRETKDAEYEELNREARAIGSTSSRRKRELSEEERSSLRAEIVRFERRLQELANTDFFSAGGRQSVLEAIEQLRSKAEPTPVVGGPRARSKTVGKTWVTRTGVHIDRIASAWLIRRFIDADAVFKFVPAKGYVPLEGELRFDMFEAEYSHEGERCTFETLLVRFAVDVPGLREVAEIVHDIDLKESKFSRPETAGVAACILGVCMLNKEDELRIAQGTVVFEGLLAQFASKPRVATT